jgi:predicted transcriptional regulator
MDASVKKTIEKEVNKAIEKMSKSGGAGSAALKELLAQTTFKPGLLDLVEQRVLKDDEFPHESSSVLKTEIGDAVSYHLGCALYKQVFEQTEAELRKKKKKLMADRKKSLKGVMEELLSVLPHSEHDPTVS